MNRISALESGQVELGVHVHTVLPDGEEDGDRPRTASW